MYIRPVKLNIVNNSLKYVIISSNDSTSLNSTSIYFYNDRFFFIAVSLDNSLLYNKFTKDITSMQDYGTLGKLNLSNSYLDTKLSFNKLSKLFYLWDSYYFKKLLIDGKAYRINKFKGNRFKLMFGRSHRTLLIAKNVFLRKKKKN